MKRVAIVSFNGIGNAGGVERVSQYLYEILSGEYEVEILTHGKFTFPKLDFFISSIIISARLFFCKYDFVICNSWQAFLYPADISFAHGTMQGYMKHVSKFKKFTSAWVIAFMEKVAAKNAKRVVAVSEHVKDDLISLYKIKPQKITVIPNCVDEKCYVPSEKTNSSDKYVLLFSGRLESGKGLASLKALSAFLETVDGWELIIASNIKQNSELFENNKHTHILYGLSANEMLSFYQKGDALFFPSLYEGFSMATLEALSCGLPVLGTDFIVTDELRQYPFLKDITEFVENPRKIMCACESLVSEFCKKKKEIHKIIAADFGKENWKAKLLTFIKEQGK